MKSRLFACLAVSLLVLGLSAIESRRAQAQQGGGQQDRPASNAQGSPSSSIVAEIDRALESYETRSGQNLEQCRKELEQMRKQLHELIDTRIQMAISLAEIQSRLPQPQQQPQMAIYGGEMRKSSASATESAEYARSVGARGIRVVEAQRPGAGDPRRQAAVLSDGLAQLQGQLRSEIDQEKAQVDQLVGRLRALRQEHQQSQELASPARRIDDEPATKK
ncbi:hypothetical protein OJF2_77310 [Aquisphaera giovannonii]|uniref:Uncharacterized protein n=1 Tax=Aquisphaera giovannonii TaxID=406548 RepID=A0A5B9WFR5_9BACT|nr:hypothetical protein [Aquisphaera giovannonii]QEH39119.1 hypothetical protein OJF2_77310 [Aquisphaera giovannonii]